MYAASTDLRNRLCIFFGENFPALWRHEFPKNVAGKKKGRDWVDLTMCKHFSQVKAT